MIVSSVIDLQAAELSEREWRKLFASLTFLDKEGHEVKTYKRLNGARVRVPRGAWSMLPDHVLYTDKRVFPKRGSILRYNVELRPEQKPAWEACIDQEQGLVIAQPGFGKTMIALHVVAAVRTHWIVFVHTQDIFDQWCDYAEKYLRDIKVGKIQGQKWTTGDLTVAMVQTVRDQMPRFRRQYAEKFGGVIVDEAHHSPAESWEIILNNCPARYRLGFTATESRADGMEQLMQHLIGPVVFRQKFELPVPARVVPLKSGLKFAYRGRFDWGPLQEAIVKNEARNKLIAETALRQMKKGRSVLILSRRIEHLERIEAHMGQVPRRDVTILTGKVVKPKRLRIIESFRQGQIKCLLSTQLMDEAVDVPILSCVILTYPGKHDGRIIQQVGRALRPHDDKTGAVIFDVVDDNIGVLRRQWLERKQTYKKLKIKVKKNKQIEENPVNPQRKAREVSARIRSRMKRR